MFSLNRFLEVKKEDQSLLYFTYYAFLCSGMMTTVLGAILPSLSEEYGLSYTLQGSLLSFHQIGNLIAVYIAGFLPYAIGRKMSTLLGASGIILGLVFMTLYGNPFFLIFSFLLTGIGRGTMSNMTNVVVGQSAGNKAGGLNLLHACFAVGAFVSPLWIISVLMLIALVLLGTSKLSSERSRKAKGGETRFLRSIGFWLNTMIMFFYLCAEASLTGWFFYLCAEASLTGWLVTYFIDSGIFPQSIATSMQSILWVMILIGRLICASVSNRMNKAVSNRMNKAVLILILGIIMTAFFSVMVNASAPVLAVIGVFGVGVSMSGIYPTTLSTMPADYNSSTVATGTCIAVATVGAILMPLVIGTVAESAGIASGITLIALALVCMLVLMTVKLVLTLKGRDLS